ncbi:sulfatase-like hydrolase/transferase [Natrialba sp. SSL1]|uniref:sulfatase-like hydrolase/transferase n=1 Tax=Natrialba sp. SSL1 TaxID=1869245 RepID=UPI000A0356A9|nr:sulfatase-like hydrolase/transferase [Natrialba sp. SSL1]
MTSAAPNILLVVLDSTRAKNTSLHDYERKTTPFLDQFSENATLYTQARAPGMTSYPSHASIFTGMEVKEHGAHDLLTHQLDPTSTIWHTLSEEHGYTTGVFSDNVNLTGDKSLKSCFDHVVGRRGRLFPKADDPDIFFNSPEYLENNNNRSKYIDFLTHCLRSDRPIRGLANGAAKQLSLSLSSSRLEQQLDHSADRFLNPFYSWIDSQNGPWAACLNLMDTHLPFYPAKEYDLWGGKELQQKQADLDPTSWKVYGEQVSWEDWNAFENIYDGTIRQVDSYLEDLVTELEEREILDETLLVITSDHGEGFGEYSRVRPDFPIAGHIVGLHESLLHVPLIVSYPNQSYGREVSDAATLRCFPEAVKAAVKGEWDGNEFVPDGPVVASASTIDHKKKNAQRAGKFCDDIDPYGGEIQAVYKNETGSVKKYLKWDDNAVTVEIKDAHTATVIDQDNAHEVVTDVFDRYSDLGVSSHQDRINNRTLEHLESLGYV